MKKKLYIILALCMVFVLSLALTACKKGKGTFEWEEYEVSAAAESTESVNLPTVPEGAAAEPSVQIHYQRLKANSYTGWQLWLWTNSGSVGSNDSDSDNGNFGWKFNYKDDWGIVALYTLKELSSQQGGTGNLDVATEQLGMIPRMQNWTKDDFGGDRYGGFGEKDVNNYYHIYIKQGVADVYNFTDSFQHGLSAKFVPDRQIQIEAASPLKKVTIYEGSDVLAENKPEQTTAKGVCTLPDNWSVDFGKTYSIEVTFADGYKSEKTEISTIAMIGGESFGSLYNYDGELGALYTQNSTEFRVWSPLSTKIVLNLYAKGNGGAVEKTAEMTKGDKGVWSVTVEGDLAAKYYTYTVYNSTYPAGKEIVDPYAKSAGLSGKRGQIVKFDETDPEGWANVTPIAYKPNELTVWETHVADVTSSSTWGGTPANAKKFLGLIETGTKYTDSATGTTVSTGFDHIKELGVNAVQFVPIFDQDNDEANVSFNWGYNPLNYNVLEGAYSSDPTDGYARIREFKQVVQAYNAAGINIIMDVVFNHVSAAIGSNFDVLCPGYFFRYNDNGELSSGSGCGNDTASDHYMFRKFMIDSVCFWAKEYKLGGFRFDLMGLHDLQTMNELTAALKKINPNIIVYGEPWDMTTATDAEMAIQTNGNKYEGFAQFSDKMRDALIKGGMNNANALGWVDGGSDTESTAIVNGMKGFTDLGGGKLINDLAKTVNYVTCHDNYTLLDRMRATGQFREPRDTDKIREVCLLANSVVFTSNGIDFMLAGEEMMRSKQELGATGEQVHNSYNATYKINELDYSRKVAHKDVFDTYVKLIDFKQKFVKDFGIETNADVSSKYTVIALNGGKAISVTINAKDGSVWKVYLANGVSGADSATGLNRTVTTADLAGYSVYLDTLGVYGADTALTAQTNILQRQVLIASKNA